MSGRGNLFSTDDAVDGTYENLEQRAYGQEIDHDNVETKRMRIRKWQHGAIGKVKRHSATNIVEVGYAAYEVGVKKMREIVGRERIKETRDIKNIAHDIAMHKGEDGTSLNESADILTDDGIEDQLSHHGDLTENKTFYFNNSTFSEIKDTYEEDAGFEPWIHRAIMSIGFLASDTLGHNVEERCEEVTEVVDETYTMSRTEQEKMLHDFVTENLLYWCQNGIHEDRLDMIEEAAGLFETRFGSEMEDAVDILRTRAEILESEDDNEQ